MSKHSLFFLFLTLGLALMFASCDEKETNMGLDLQDPSTIYKGVVDTAYGTAYVVLDTSLLTTGRNAAIIGSGYDANVASTEASFFTNVSTSNETGITFDDTYSIDSVVLSLAISGVYVPSSDSSSSQDVHFVISQLKERLSKDSAYHSDSQVEVSNTIFFDDVVTVQRSDSMVVKLKLTNAFASLVENHSYATADEFEVAVKGMCIKLAPSTSTRNYVAINLSASGTRLTVYYTLNGDDAPAPRSYDLAIGTDITHFSQFKKTFLGEYASFNSNRLDSVSTSTMYLSPLGGTNIRFDIDSFVRQFHKSHPLAIIHYAELVLPVNTALSPSDRPDALAAIKVYANGNVENVPDFLDPFTSVGFGGTFDAASNCYRMRITQHLQDLVRDGRDYGTLVVISGRRTSWQQTVVNGDMTSNPIRVEFVYSE